MKRYFCLLILTYTLTAEEFIFTLATCNMLRHKSYVYYATQQIRPADKAPLTPQELLTQDQRRNIFTQAFIDPLQFKDVDIICLQEWDQHIGQTIPAHLQFFSTQRTAPLGAETQIRFVDVATLINTQKFSVIDTNILELELKPGQKADRGLLSRLKFNNAQSAPSLCVVNCHIPWHNEQERVQQLAHVQNILRLSKPPSIEQQNPLIICGDFNYNTYYEHNIHGYIPKDETRPYAHLANAFPKSYWVDAGYWDADFDEQKVLPTSYMEGFERNDYIFFTREPATQAASWKLELVKFSVYPTDLRNLLKHRKRSGFDIAIDGPVSDGYFSDHAIVKATFKLTITDRLPEFMKNLELDLRSLLSR